MATEKGKVPNQNGAVERRRETNNLTVRYGSIGISAVVAALRYSDAGKNPAYAPVVAKIDLKRIEVAA